MNGLNGNVINIVFTSGEIKERIRHMFWSDTEPNLTLIRDGLVSTYNIVQLY